MKKLNQGGIGIVASLVIITLVGIIGFAGWRVYGSQTSEEPASQPEPEPKQTTVEKPGENERADIPSDWVKYDNEQLGISFYYPGEWGEVEKTEFDGEGNSQYFIFTEYENFGLGGLEKDYEHGGRGASLADYGGFIENEDGSFSFRDRVSKQPYLDEFNSTSKYTLNENGTCIYSVAVIHYETTNYHATCNLNSKDMNGFNFSAIIKDTSGKTVTKLTEADFIQIINSVGVR